MRMVRVLLVFGGNQGEGEKNPIIGLFLPSLLVLARGGKVGLVGGCMFVCWLLCVPSRVAEGVCLLAAKNSAEYISFVGRRHHHERWMDINYLMDLWSQPLVLASPGCSILDLESCRLSRRRSIGGTYSRLQKSREKVPDLSF